jgi:hypothetical protein
VRWDAASLFARWSVIIPGAPLVPMLQRGKPTDRSSEAKKSKAYLYAFVTHEQRQGPFLPD